MRFALFIIFSVKLLTVVAQPKPIIQDDFSSNKYGWEESTLSFFANGEYVINSTEEGDQSVINFFIDPQKDFIISGDFVQQSGLDDNGFGLVWGSGSENYNLFVISSQGDYAIHGGDPAQLRNWKHHDAIKPLGNPNKLKIEWKSGKLSFYVNEVKIEEHKPMPFFGSAIGFTTFTQMRLSIDNFLFAQDQTIELPTETLTNKKENLGPSINSENDDLGPIISMDGKLLYMARQNVIGNVGGVTDDEDRKSVV